MKQNMKQLIDSVETDISGKWVRADNVEKLVKLVVRECCSIIETDLETNQIRAETDNEGKIWVNAQLTFSEVIKLHFGVDSIPKMEKIDVGMSKKTLDLCQAGIGAGKSTIGWVCPVCGVDRTKDVCPGGHSAALTGQCPMVGVAQ